MLDGHFIFTIGFIGEIYTLYQKGIAAPILLKKKYSDLKTNSQSSKNHYGKKQLLIPLTSLGRKD